MNGMVSSHNKCMLLSLAMLVALSIAQQLRRSTCSNPKEEKLESNILLCIGQKVMLCSNLWVETGLLNCALGKVKAIVYRPGERPPQLPLFVVVHFKNYKGPMWDHNQQKNVSTTLVSRVVHYQIPLKLAWALTIHKSQGLTLQRATIDIDNIDCQGLTFTAISRVHELASLHIHPTFTFEIYSHMQTNPYVPRRKQEEERLH